MLIETVWGDTRFTYSQATLPGTEKLSGAGIAVLDGQLYYNRENSGSSGILGGSKLKD
jgi:hypothetical protein